MVYMFTENEEQSRGFVTRTFGAKKIVEKTILCIVLLFKVFFKKNANP